MNPWLWYAVAGLATALPSLNVVYERGAVPLLAATQFVAMDPSRFEIVAQGSQQFLCEMPDPPQPPANITVSSALLADAVSIIQRLFEPDLCLFQVMLHNEYWTYAYCLGDKIVQYHQDLEALSKRQEYKVGTPNAIFTLGRFKGSLHKTKDTLTNQLPGNNRLDPQEFLMHNLRFHSFFESDELDPETPQLFVVHTLYDGTECDLTKEPRLVDVIYRCANDGSKHPHITDLLEVQICRYQMVVAVPGLCALPGFKPDTLGLKPVPIKCREIGGEENWDTMARKDKKNGRRRDKDEKRDKDERENRAKDHRIRSASEFDAFNHTKSRVFPTKGSRINFADFQLVPLGLGFSLGYGITNSAHGRRLIVVHTGTPGNVAKKFVNVFRRTLHRSFPSPVVLDDFQVYPLEWSDAFKLWYEVYSLLGLLDGVMKLERRADGGSDDIFYYTWVDPDTMLDALGDPVDMPVFMPPNYNFEYFRRQLPNGQDVEIKYDAAAMADGVESHVYSDIAAQLNVDGTQLKQILGAHNLHLAQKTGKLGEQAVYGTVEAEEAIWGEDDVWFGDEETAETVEVDEEAGGYEDEDASEEYEPNGHDGEGDGEFSHDKYSHDEL